MSAIWRGCLALWSGLCGGSHLLSGLFGGSHLASPCAGGKIIVLVFKRVCVSDPVVRSRHQAAFEAPPVPVLVPVLVLVLVPVLP